MSKKADKLFRNAQDLMAKRSYGKAIKAFQQYLEIKPDDKKALYTLGDAYAFDGKYADATKIYLDVADYLKSSGFTMKAIAVCKRILNLNPNSSRAKSLLQELYYEKSSEEESSKILFQQPEEAEAEAAEKNQEEEKKEQAALNEADNIEPETDEEVVVSGMQEIESDDSASEFDQLGSYTQTVAIPRKKESDKQSPEPELTTADLADIFGRQSPDTADKIDVSEEKASSVQAVLPDESDLVDSSISSADEEYGSQMLHPGLDNPLTMDSLMEEVEAAVQEEAVKGSASPHAPTEAAFSDVEVVELQEDVISETIPPALTEIGDKKVGTIRTKTQENRVLKAKDLLFGELTSDEYFDIISLMDIKTFHEGETVVREGEPGNSMFIICSGEVSVTTEDKNGNEVKLASLTEGDFFGEVALLTGKPRTATIYALEQTDLLELTNTTMPEIEKRHPRIREVLEDFYMKRIQSTIQRLIPDQQDDN